jgi:hypothetical protein
MDNTIERIRFLTPVDGEVIVLYYQDGMNLDMLQQTYNSIVAEFPNNKVIALNKSLQLATMEKDSLIQFLQT